MPSVPKVRKPSWMTGGKHIDPSLIKENKPQCSKVPLINGVKLYSTNRHRKTSEAHRAVNPYCHYCLQNGIYTAATLMDHIIPVNRGGAIWDGRNHASCCDLCHNIKRQKEGRGIILPHMTNEIGELIPYTE